MLLVAGGNLFLVSVAFDSFIIDLKSWRIQGLRPDGLVKGETDQRAVVKG